MIWELEEDHNTAVERAQALAGQRDQLIAKLHEIGQRYGRIPHDEGNTPSPTGSGAWSEQTVAVYPQQLMAEGGAAAEDAATSQASAEGDSEWLQAALLAVKHRNETLQAELERTKQERDAALDRLMIMENAEMGMIKGGMGH